MISIGVGPTHIPLLGVKVYTVVAVLSTVAGFHVPEIPFVEVVGNGAITSPIQMGSTCTNVGVSVGLTTTTDYTFTPDAGQCATTPAPVQVVVNPIITTTFDPIPAICEGDPNPLPATDLNGVTGTWSPAFDPTTTTDYTFTPDAGQCASTPAPVQVVVNPIITTTFDPIPAICEGDA